MNIDIDAVQAEILLKWIREEREPNAAELREVIVLESDLQYIVDNPDLEDFTY